MHGDPGFNRTWAPYLATLPPPGTLLVAATMLENELPLLQGRARVCLLALCLLPQPVRPLLFTRHRMPFNRATCGAIVSRFTAAELSDVWRSVW